MCLEPGGSDAGVALACLGKSGMTLAVFLVDATLVGLGVAAFLIVDRQVRPAQGSAPGLGSETMPDNARDLLRNVPANDVEQVNDMTRPVKTII
jgi:hypothetical protein